MTFSDGGVAVYERYLDKRIIAYNELIVPTDSRATIHDCYEACLTKYVCTLFIL